MVVLSELQVDSRSLCWRSPALFMSDFLRVNVVVVDVSNIEECAGTFDVFVTSGGFLKGSAVLVVPFNTVVVSFQPILPAFDGDAMGQCRDVEKELVEAFSEMLESIRCEIELLTLLLRFKELAVATLLYVGINLFCSPSIRALSRRESVYAEFGFAVFADPPVTLLFFILNTNSSMFIFPLNSGICFMLHSRSTAPYFFVQL